MSFICWLCLIESDELFEYKMSLIPYYGKQARVLAYLSYISSKCARFK